MSDSNKISGDQSESSAVETSNEESNVTSPRFNKYQKARGRKAKALKPEKKQRKSKQAYDFNDSEAKEEEDRKNRLAKAEADYKEEEKRQVKKAKEAAQRNEEVAKALLEEHLHGVFGVKIIDDETTLSFDHYVETSTPRFLRGDKKETKKETVLIKNVKHVKLAQGNFKNEENQVVKENQVVIVVLSRPEADLPGKFEEFVVDVEKKTVTHNYINNLFGGAHFNKDMQFWKPIYKKTTGSHVHYKNPDYGIAPKLEYMKQQEKDTIEMFEMSKDADKLHTNFEFGTTHYGGFYAQETINGRRPKYSLDINHPMKN